MSHLLTDVEDAKLDPANLSPRNRGDKSEYLVAGRSLGVLPISLSIAAAWMWAPALLVAAMLGYLYGFWGVFWFSVPNIAAVVIFGPVAVKAREKLASGVTYSGFQARAHSRRVMWLFVIQDALGLFANMLANTIAGGFVAQYVFGWPFWVGAAAVLIVPLLYTLPGGFRISTVTDVFTMTVIVGVVAIVSLATIIGAGISTLAAGYVGTGEHSFAFIAAGLGVALSVHLLASPYSDQTLWQRAWAAPIHKVRKAFRWGAIFFAPVPILCGAVGMVAAGAGLKLEDPQSALFAGASAFLPSFVVPILGFAVLLAVVDTIDSCMSAVSAFVSDDNALARSVSVGKAAMIAMTAIVGIVSLTNLPIFSVQLLYGAVAASSLLPGLMTLFRDRLPAEPAMFWGIIVGGLIAFPVFAWGVFGGGGDFVTALGIVLGVAASGVLVWVLDRMSFAPARYAETVFADS